MAKILVVEDEAGIREILALFLASRGHQVTVATSGEEAIAQGMAIRPDLAILDVMLPGISGVDTFRRLRETLPRMGGIFVTGFGSVRSAVDAIKAGADDYLTKPFDNEELLFAVNRVLELGRLSREVEALREELQTRYGFDEIIGVCPAMCEVFRIMSRVAANDATVLVLGESGTGKELVARAIHRQSRRASGPFVAVNCSAIPSTLMEAEFFGHERGAFTDAKETHQGRFEQAHGGTLFLDEVGDLPLDAQAKLLRVLQDREVTRLGGRGAIRVDVRIISATNKNLEHKVRKGEFRDDLYYRLNVLSLRLPALRERHEDLSLLIDAMLRRLASELRLGVKGLSASARELLVAHDWPGNVRELKNTLRRALILCEGDVIEPTDLPLRIAGRLDDGEATGSPEQLTLAQAVRRAVERIERNLIRATLAQTGGSRTMTAEALGINRKTLFVKMREYAIDDSIEEDTD